jgi:hypothetical protein
MKDPNSQATPKRGHISEEKRAYKAAEEKAIAQAAFLIQRALGHTLSYSAKVASSGLTTIREWRQADPAFDAACVQARDEGVDAIEEILISMAQERNLGAVIYALKISGRGETRADSGTYDFDIMDLAEKAERVNHEAAGRS